MDCRGSTESKRARTVVLVNSGVVGENFNSENEVLSFFVGDGVGETGRIVSV